MIAAMPDQVVYIVAAIVGLMLFLAAACFFVVVALIATAYMKKPATSEDKAIDFSDGLDERELGIIAGMVRRVKQTEAEQAAVATMQSAAALATVTPPPAKPKPTSTPAA